MVGTEPALTPPHCVCLSARQVCRQQPPGRIGPPSSSTSQEVTVARDKDEAINSYITDMLSLEEHIGKAVRGQLEDLEDYPEVTRDLRQILRKVEQHVSDLKQLSDQRRAQGGREAIKTA